MSIDTLKPLLIILAIGLASVLFLTLDSEDLPNLSISAAFNRLVDECQAAHPDWDEETCEQIVRNEIRLGMTSEMVVASIGEPRRILDPRAEDQTYIDWVYVTSRYGEEFFRFEDDVLIAVIEGEDCTSCGISLDRDVKDSK